MFCGNIFTSTDLQNHKKNHMKKSQKKVQPGQWLLPCVVQPRVSALRSLLPHLDFTDVTLACEDNRLNQAHRAILSVSSHPKMNQAKYNHLQASLGEFLAICSAGGTVNLTFTTTRGNTSSNMNVSHGHLGPPPPPHRPRNRGPAARERRRQRAACHQAAPPASTAPAVLAPPSPATAAPAAAPSPAPVDHPVTFATMAAKPAAKPVAP